MSNMIYRRFGRTELQMSVFSCGGMRYQDGWQDKPLSEVDPEGQKNLEATIHRALEVGINHIETARGYGVSERQLGAVLPKLPREKMIVQTKVGPSEDPDEFLANCYESLERLQLDYVDLLAIHGINADEPLEYSLRKGGCLAAARKFQQAGKCRHVGFATHGMQDTILKAIQHEADGGFDYVNLHWYWIYQRNWACIEEATRRDMGVFIISPSDKGGKLYAPAEKLVELCQPLHPMVFNDLFCLSHPQVHTLSIGASRPTDFDRHLETLPLLERADELLPPIIERLKAAMLEATGGEYPETGVWDLPDHRAAPGGLSLPLVLWLRNLARGWGMTDYGKMRFNLMGNGGHWFPGAKPQTVEEIADSDLIAACGDADLAPRVPELVRDAVDLLGGEEVKRASQGG